MRKNSRTKKRAKWPLENQERRQAACGTRRAKDRAQDRSRRLKRNPRRAHKRLIHDRGASNLIWARGRDTIRPCETLPGNYIPKYELH